MTEIKLFDFQNQAVDKLLSEAMSLENKGLVLKAPTGSGKTLILLEFVKQFLSTGKNENTVFIWFSPGIGELEEQSKTTMDSYIKEFDSFYLKDALKNGFGSSETFFINWEQVNSKVSTALSDSEELNLIERIKEAHLNQIKFIVIVDEEHLYNTSNSNRIINYFCPEFIVRASATPKQRKKYSWYEISEIDVINEGLITKTLRTNENLENVEVKTEFKTLIDMANKKRQEIKDAYHQRGLDINPLILIQFPDDSAQLINSVELYLESLGYSYNLEIAKWLSESENKINLDNITKNDGKQIFLLMKQAVATGWNCPRAKILVKLRDNMTENFKIQTIGRIRRMPQAKHYNDELLDNCFLYTFDEKFKAYTQQELSISFEVRRLELKEKCMVFNLEKESKSENDSMIGVKSAYQIIEKYFYNELKLKDVETNPLIFAAHGYLFDEEIISTIPQGDVVLTDDLKNLPKIRKKIDVNIKENQQKLTQVIVSLKEITGLSYTDTNNIIQKLFLNSKNGGKLLKLSLKTYYAFVINNREKLKTEFRNIVSKTGVQMSMSFFPKTTSFKIPKETLLPFDSEIENVQELLTNAYYDYKTDCFVKRTKPERLFERYCEENSNVDWVYKNGDCGQEFFSIIYFTGMLKQFLFYPDYILKLKNGDIWIVESKGGESESGKTKNIDIYSEKKFEALKKYAKKHNINFGFVREKIVDDKTELFMNNTTYTEDMNTEHWKKINVFF